MKLRYYQEEAIQSIFDYFESRRGSLEPANPVVAMPTGTGKSVVIGDFIRRVMSWYPTTRVMMLTHVKELIKQNAEKITELWHTAPLGIYSAGLRRKELEFPIIYGGVQSVVKNADLFGRRDLLLIDEAHLLSPKADTSYQEIIKQLHKRNPWIKIIGFTATPYRMRTGLITNGGMFTDICYDITGLEAFNRLIAEGWLSMPIPKQMQTDFDLSNVSIQNGDFSESQMQAVMDDDRKTYEACREIVSLGANRRSWLTFCAGIEHAEHVAACLNTFGIPAAAVHSKMGDDERDKRIAAFKSGRLRCLTNNGVLTTGFDHPPIDLIAALRGTMSPGLWVQIVGRGTRPSIETGKENCLVLDFGGNTARLGPINDIEIPDPARKKRRGSAPFKYCPHCATMNHTRAVVCIDCGAELPTESKIETAASPAELIRTSRDEMPIVETFDVSMVFYYEHDKGIGTPPTMKVSYLCGPRIFNEYIAFEHQGYRLHLAHEFWRQRTWSEIPETVKEALSRTSELAMPKRIKVWINKKYPEVMGYEF